MQNVTKIEPLNYFYNKGEGKSPNYAADDVARRIWLGLIAANMSDITLDILGTVSCGDAPTLRFSSLCEVGA